jgi:ATP-dependent Lon protease
MSTICYHIRAKIQRCGAEYYLIEERIKTLEDLLCKDTKNFEQYRDKLSRLYISKDHKKEELDELDYQLRASESEDREGQTFIYSNGCLGLVG